MKLDQKGYLETEPFAYQKGKDGKVFLFWEGKQVSLLKGKAASKFLTKVEGLSSFEVQLVLAKLTGNFKRGNEKGR